MPAPEAPRGRVRRRFRLGRVSRRFLRNRLALGSLVVLGVLCVISLISVWWLPGEATGQQLARRLEHPSREHLLGTDNLGRDMLSRLMVATRVALVSSTQAVGLAMVVGIPLGLLAGYAGGPADAIASRLSDVLLSLPPLIFAVAIVGVLGPGLTNAMIAVGILLMPRFFRVTRAAAQEYKHEMFVEAARSSGTPHWRILYRHILPNIASPILIQISFGASVAIVAESGLSFLGLGAQPPTASWGSMLKEGFDQLNDTTWHIMPPSMMIIVTILVLSLLGDGLRDAIGRQTSGGRR